MSEVDRLIRDLLRHGLEVAHGGKHHAVLRDGKRVGTLPVSPSDHRALENARHQLSRAGVLPRETGSGGGGRGKRPEVAPRPYDGPRLAPGRIPRRRKRDDL